MIGKKAEKRLQMPMTLTFTSRLAARAVKPLPKPIIRNSIVRLDAKAEATDESRSPHRNMIIAFPQIKKSNSMKMV